MITSQIDRQGNTTIICNGVERMSDHAVSTKHVEYLNRLRKVANMPERNKLIARLQEYGSEIPEDMKSGW